MERIDNWPGYLSREVVFPAGEKPVFEYLRQNALSFPERTAIVFYGGELSYADLDSMSESFANYLLSRGFVKGDRIALFLPSCPQYHIVHYGICKMGGVVVPCSPVFKEWELTYELEDSGASAVVSLDLLLPVVRPACATAGIETIISTSLQDFLPEKPTIELLPMMKIPKTAADGAADLLDIIGNTGDEPSGISVGLDDVVQLQYTGGTTGLPKGAVLTHGAKLFKVAAIYTILRDSAKYLGCDSENLMTLCTLPTFHIAGMLGSVDSAVMAGNSQVLMTMFDAASALDAIEKYKVRFFQSTVPMNTGIMEHPSLADHDLSSLVLTITTSFGLRLTSEIASQWREATGGCPLVEASYGLSETHTFDTFMPLDRPKYDDGCQGIPLFETDVRIVSFDDRSKELPAGEMGEIAIKNPAVFSGYWNRPDETRETLVDGYVFTGDMGRVDPDGYLYFLGRKKEMIKTSGFSVFPEEVEVFLCRHPGIEKAAAIGLPDKKRGEVIKAFIVPSAEYRDKINPADIISWAKQGISSYKVPKSVDIRDDLPMSGTGKVLRRLLLEEETAT